MDRLPFPATARLRAYGLPARTLGRFPGSYPSDRLSRDPLSEWRVIRPEPTYRYTLRDYSGVIRRNATRYLVPGAILLQVVGEVEGPLECDIDSFFGAV